MEKYRDPFWVRHPLVTVGLVVVAVLSFAGAFWAVRVALSPVKGAGDVIIQQNDADNMIGAQKELRQRYEGLPAACARIAIAKEAADADPGNRITAANHTAAKQHYVTLVAEYNAATQMLLMRGMLGDLPERVPTTMCPGVN